MPYVQKFMHGTQESLHASDRKRNIKWRIQLQLTDSIKCSRRLSSTRQMVLSTEKVEGTKEERCEVKGKLFELGDIVFMSEKNSLTMSYSVWKCGRR